MSANHTLMTAEDATEVSHLLGIYGFAVRSDNCTVTVYSPTHPDYGFVELNDKKVFLSREDVMEYLDSLMGKRLFGCYANAAREEIKKFFQTGE